MPKDKIGDVKVMNNEYDNEKFFEEYAKMSRSKEGLKAAGEWHQLKPLFPSLEGKSVLDLGCGYGCSEPRKLDKMKFNRRVHFFYEIDRKTEKRNLSKT